MIRCKMGARGAAVGGMAAIVLLLGACGGSASDQSSDSSAETLVAPPDSTIPGAIGGPPEGTQHFAGLKREHTDDPVAYPQTPPVGGMHSPKWATCGFYAESIETEQGVHSMEHGAVWLTYSPDLAADQVATLQAMVAGRTHLLVTPFDGLPTPVVASAWGEQLQLQSASDPRLLEFVNYYEQGPQTPEPGVPC